MGNLIDLTGQKFGEWTVLERDFSSKSSQAKWKCQCSCGNIKIVYGYGLRSGTSTNCGCKRGRDLKNQKFGSLTVLERSDKKTEGSNRCIIWKCKCDCGNITYVNSQNLINGHVKHCKECGYKITAQKLTKDLTGQQFGKLTVINQVPSDKNGTRWLCQCECGTQKIISGKSLLYLGTISCGCVKSKGELKIIQILQENNIKYQTQKSFETCKITNHPLFFDFYINDSYLIEFDGKQHFDDVTSGWGIDLKEIQTRDNFKNQWCKNNNIPLIRIPYTHYNDLCLEDLLLETSQFIFRMRN